MKILKVQKYIKQNYLLFLFYTFLILLYYDIPFLEFVVFIPLFLYFKKNKKIPTKTILSINVFIGTICLFHFRGFGLDFILMSSVAFFLFLTPLMLISHYFIKKKQTFAVPILYFVLLKIFEFLPFNNFWINISVFLNSHPILIQYLGSYFISTLIILYSVCISELLIKKEKKYLITLAIIVLIFLIPIQTMEIDKTTKVLGVQSNLNQTWNERFENSNENLRKHITLTQKFTKNYSPEIVIWQEYLFPQRLEFDLETLNQLKNLTKENNFTLIVGSTKLQSPKENFQKYYDSLYVIKGNNIQYYNSYEVMNIFEKELVETNSNKNILINNNPIGLIICFEETYPYIYSKQVNENNPEFFISTGNEYFLKNKFALRTNSLSSNLRSAESNKYSVRLRPTGTTKVIDNKGNTVKSIKEFEEGPIMYNIPNSQVKTFYMKYKTIVEVLLLLLALITLLALKLKNSKS